MGFQMPNMNGPSAGEDDDDDDDLEAELQRLQYGAGGGPKGAKSKANQRTSNLISLPIEHHTRQTLSCVLSRRCCTKSSILS